MDCIQINCDECNIDKHPDATLVDFNCDEIKYIINSNYITCINFCVHKRSELRQFFSYTYGITFLPHYYSGIVNTKYTETFNRFLIEEQYDKTLNFFSNNSSKKEVQISVDQFISTIKKGTIIRIIDRIVPQLEELLLERNTNFILNKIEKCGRVIYMIDTPNYTKPSIKPNNH